MTTPAAALLMDQFLGWLADRPRRYAQTMEAWRSSCPRLSVWEDALADGLLSIRSGPTGMGEAEVRLSPAGRARLAAADQARFTPQKAKTSETGSVMVRR